MKMSFDVFSGIMCGFLASFWFESKVVFAFSSFLDPAYMHPVQYNVGKFGANAALMGIAIMAILFFIKVLWNNELFSIKYFFAALFTSGILSSFCICPVLLLIMAKVYIFMVDGIWTF